MIAILQEFQAIGGIAQNFWMRNNPVGTVVANMKNAVDYVINFSSHRKLMKYRSIVYLKQLNKMEQNLWSGVLTPEGDKLDRYY
jgi:hypothetical protein